MDSAGTTLQTRPQPSLASSSEQRFLPLRPEGISCDCPHDLHDEYRLIFARMAALHLAPGDPTRMPLAEARQASLRYHAYWNADPPEVEEIFERTAPWSGGVLRLRFYRHRAGSTSPIAIYFHGGGFALNSVDTHDRLLRLLAIEAKVTICALSYSLAPERRFPHQLGEAVAAVRWLVDAASDLDIDPGAVALAGDSAGANLALAAALALRDQGDSPVVRLLLFYGMYVPEFHSEAHHRYGGGAYGLTTERMRWFWNAYLGQESRKSDPYAAPLCADLHGLPPALIIAAGRDCLRDDSLRLAERLHAAAVPNVLSFYQDVPHAFMQLSRSLSAATAAISEAAAVLRALRSS